MRPRSSGERRRTRRSRRRERVREGKRGVDRARVSRVVAGSGARARRPDAVRCSGERGRERVAQRAEARMIRAVATQTREMHACAIPARGVVRLGGDHPRRRFPRRPDGPRDSLAARPARRARAPPSSSRTTTTKRPHPARSSRPSRRRRRRARSGRVGRPPTPRLEVATGRAHVRFRSRPGRPSARRTSTRLVRCRGAYRAPFATRRARVPDTAPIARTIKPATTIPIEQPDRWSVRGGRLSPPIAAEQRRVLRSWRSRHRTSDPRGVARLQVSLVRCVQQPRPPSLLFAIRRIFRRFTGRHL